MTIRVFATHDALLPSDRVPGIPTEYVYYFDHKEAILKAKRLVVELEQLNATLQRVIARQDVMLVARDKYDSQ